MCCLQHLNGQHLDIFGPFQAVEVADTVATTLPTDTKEARGW